MSKEHGVYKSEITKGVIYDYKVKWEHINMQRIEI